MATAIHTNPSGPSPVAMKSTAEPLGPMLDDVGRASWKAVYTIIERGSRKHWLRIGVAFVNRDGSLNVRLDAMPTNGQLHIRETWPRDGRDGRDDAGESGLPDGSPRSLWKDS